VLFDRICRENGIKHLLTAPRSPTTTGKVERFHKTLRREFLNGKVFTDLADAQTQLDGWVREYNFDRPHQSLGMAVPWDRFRLAMTDTVADVAVDSSAEESIELGVSRRVGGSGLVSFAGASYLAGRWLAGESVTVVCDRGLVHLQHRGALIATHARRHRVEKARAAAHRKPRDPKRPATASAVAVTRKVDSSGTVSLPAPTTASGRSTGVSRSRSPSSAPPSRSASTARFCERIRLGTTPPRTTAPTPPPAAGLDEPTPPN